MRLSELLKLVYRFIIRKNSCFEVAKKKHIFTKNKFNKCLETSSVSYNNF